MTTKYARLLLVLLVLNPADLWSAAIYRRFLSGRDVLRDSYRVLVGATRRLLKHAKAAINRRTPKMALLVLGLVAVFSATLPVRADDDRAAAREKERVRKEELAREKALAKEKELLAREHARLRQQRFHRQGATVLEQVSRYAKMDESKMSLADRFLRAFYEGRWEEVRTTLEGLSDADAAATYDKMLEDMTGGAVPLLTLDDFLGLADACPNELTTDRIRRLGQLLRVAVAKEQEIWLKKALDKGTRRLGRADEKKLATGRILAFAAFDELAREFMPGAAEASQMADAGIRDEIVKFLASHEELEEFQQKQIAALWEQHAAVLANPAAQWGERQQAADRLTELLGKAPTAQIEPWIRKLMGTDIEGGLRLATTLGRSAPTKGHNSDVAVRANNLKTQKCLLLCASEHTDLGKVPWSQVATIMADWWIREAEHCFQYHSSFQGTGGGQRPHVIPEDLLESAPGGAWAKALPESLRDRVDVCLSKAVLVSDRYEEAVDLIVKIADRNRKAGVALAEDYVKAWAYRHDPKIPDEIRRKHKLDEDARIAVTPIMMEKNVASLAKMMDVFRNRGIPPKNAKLLADAFVVCYSTAEVYRRSHIEKVFGPVETMDEEIFLQMIRTMTEGLASRWRKIDVQKESGTRRTQSETLEMVREGYRSAIAMIDQRAAKNADSWRILTLAGSLASDWGDFEYYQQLAGDAKANRMGVFREKNGLAQQYFTRAAEGYAAQLPKLGRGRYAIDVYLAWFHSLLGINTGGELNLSKPLDRRALGKIHAMIRALPGDAPQVHIDQFARHVNARLEDKKQPLHEDLKYRYLAGSLVITRDSPFSFQANSKVGYYDELLREIRLETRVDGAGAIHRDQHFGIIFSVHHTEAMGRMADFGKYLVNQAPALNPAWSRPQQSSVTVYRMRDVKGRRDDLELNIREALSLFFDVKSVTFSPRDVQARATDRPGWKETVLAYVLVKAKDSSVDKIPRVQMSFEFLDLAGPVSISAESPETMIKITDQKSPPRPFHRVDLAETLDARNLAASEEVLLEIKATVAGLAPDLEDVIDLDSLGKQLPVTRIDPHEGMVVRELNSWGDNVHAVSERRWTLALAGSSLVKPPRRIELRLPAPKVAGGAAKYQAYQDADLIDLAEPVSIVGLGTGDVETEAPPAAIAWLPYAIGGGAAAATLLVALVVALRVRARGPRPLRARDVFHMPARLDGFVVIQLLRSLGSSSLVRLSDAKRAQMQGDIDRIEIACFGGNGSSLSEEELRSVARKWLQVAR